MNEDLFRLIAWRVLANDLTDYACFRAVCRHWRSSTVCPRGCGVVDGRFHPRRWMMLLEGHGLYPSHGKLRGYIRFFNLDNGKFVRVKLPIFRDHCVLDSVNGVLFMYRDEDAAIRLFHPFTGDVVNLPPLVPLARYVDPDMPGASHPVHKLYYLGGVCASFSVSATGVVTAMLALYRIGRVAFATSGDNQWSLSTWKLDYRNPLSFQGKLYLVRMSFVADQASEIFQVDPPLVGSISSSLPAPKLIATLPAGKLARPILLAECDSQILVVGHRDRSFLHVVVYRLSRLVLDKFVPIRSIGDRALLLNERTLCLSATRALPTIVGDAILYPNQKNGTLTQYHLTTNTWPRPVDGCILSGPVFGPCCLMHHIYTCCRREYWNKGQLYVATKACKWRGKGKWRHGV